MPPDLTDKSREDLAWEIVRLRQENAELKRMVFGRKSERFVGSGPDGQLSLELGADQKTAVEGQVDSEEITYTRQKKQGGMAKIHPGRAPLPAHLPRVEVTIEPAEDTEGLVRIGEEITEELDYKPGQFFVRRYRRPKYVKADGEGVLIGSLPTRPIDKGVPGAGLLAQILVDKYVDHLPLYRQGKRFEREGVKIADSTLGDWLRQAVYPLQPLYQAMKNHLLQSGYIQADETTIKVLDKDKKGSTHLGYYWVYHALESKIAIFDYQKGRGRDGPAQFLQHYQGDLQCDGYEAYELFESRSGVRVLNCMAHGRRYFEKA
ncbi:MAG: IS66 family transposase, partial [Thermoanaerobaculia bacterium]|nr:IS66 family transposase [Thermoanaerobaculia bacterium]